MLQFPEPRKLAVRIDLNYGLIAELTENTLVLLAGSKSITFERKHFEELRRFLFRCTQESSKDISLDSIEDCSITWFGDVVGLSVHAGFHTIDISHAQVHSLLEILSNGRQDESCSNCYFSRPNGTQNLDCRFEPPELLDGYIQRLPGSWRSPVVTHDWWCGKWKEKRI